MDNHVTYCVSYYDKVVLNMLDKIDTVCKATNNQSISVILETYLYHCEKSPLLYSWSNNLLITDSNELEENPSYVAEKIDTSIAVGK